MEQAKRLYRNRYDTVIAGVAGGLAKYFNIDPIIARIVFVVLVFTGGSGVLIYIVLWIALPVDPDLSFHSYNFKSAYQNPEPAAGDQPFDAGTGEETKTETNAGSESYNQKYGPYAEPAKKQGEGNLIAGIVLIVIGGLFLVTRFFSHISLSDLWPVLLIVGGILILKSSLTKPKNNY